MRHDLSCIFKVTAVHQLAKNVLGRKKNRLFDTLGRYTVRVFKVSVYITKELKLRVFARRVSSIHHPITHNSYSYQICWLRTDPLVGGGLSSSVLCTDYNMIL